MENARNIGLKTYPELQKHFKEIREWVNAKSFHTPGEYFQTICQLHRLMRITEPIKFITPRGPLDIDVIYAKNLLRH